jgi:hypothetical protein
MVKLSVMELPSGIGVANLALMSRSAILKVTGGPPVAKWSMVVAVTNVSGMTVPNSGMSAAYHATLSKMLHSGEQTLESQRQLNPEKKKNRSK